MDTEEFDVIDGDGNIYRVIHTKTQSVRKDRGSPVFDRPLHDYKTSDGKIVSKFPDGHFEIIGDAHSPNIPVTPVD